VSFIQKGIVSEQLDREICGSNLGKH